MHTIGLRYRTVTGRLGLDAVGRLQDDEIADYRTGPAPPRESPLVAHPPSPQKGACIPP